MSIRNITSGNIRPIFGIEVPVRRWVSMAVVTLAIVLSSATASASCGNYLYRNGKPVSGHAMPVESVHQVIAKDVQAQTHPLEVPVRRCTGPNCSRNSMPVVPVPAAPSNLIRGFDQAAILDALIPLCRPEGGIEFPESERGACFEPSSVFRPPAV